MANLREEMLQECEEIHFKVSSNISDEKLKVNLTQFKALVEQINVFGGNLDEDKVYTIADLNVLLATTLQAYIGTMDTNESDTPKTDRELELEAIKEARERDLALHRCILTCLDPQMKDFDTTPFLSVNNSITKYPKIVVPFEVPHHIPNIYYEFLKAQKRTISVAKKDDKGRPIKVVKLTAKYGIEDLPPLSAEELQELQTVQMQRDGMLAKQR